MLKYYGHYVINYIHKTKVHLLVLLTNFILLTNARNMERIKHFTDNLKEAPSFLKFFQAHCK